MKFLRIKSLVAVLFLLTFVFYLFLIYPYVPALVEYYSLSESGLTYSTEKENSSEDGRTIFIEPVSARFGLLIPQLGLNKKINELVDFYDEKKLERALRSGLAHVSSSSLPGDFGATLLVGHPLHSFFNFAHLNPEFYLINKLEVGDEVIVFYNFSEFAYRVKTKKLVAPTYLDFFDPGEERGLVLVSGYPSGMALKYWVIEAEEVL